MGGKKRDSKEGRKSGDVKNPEILSVKLPGDKNSAKAKEAQRKSTIYVLIILAAVILSIAGVAVFNRNYHPTPKTIGDLIGETVNRGLNTSTRFVYNGFGFVRSDGLWYTEIKEGKNVYTIPLHFSPRELGDVRLIGDVPIWTKWVSLATNFTYITFDPGGSQLQYVALANSELVSNLVQALSVKPVIACTNRNVEVCKTVPQVNCTNRRGPVIYLKIDSPNKIWQDSNCLIIQGNATGIVKSVERLIYQWYGIMP